MVKMNNEQTTNEVLQLGTLNLTLTPDTYFLMFHDVTNDNKEVGKFFLKDGLFEFEGDTTESARIFVEEIKRMFKDSIEQSIAEES
jgi:hypothetical protein